MAKKKNVKKATIKKAPPGTYDPALDYQQRAAQRGLRDLIGAEGDYTRRGQYALEDLTIGGEDIARQRREMGEDYGVNVADVEQGYRRTMEDLLSQEQGVIRDYQRLGNRQAQNFRASGLAGGAVQQAQQKRATNQAIDIAPINVSRTRAGENRQASLDDLLRQYTRGGETLDRGVGELGRGYARETTDLDILGRRAQRETGIQSRELGQTRMQQYLQGGGQRQVKFNLNKPKQKAKYQRFRKLGVI
jgi:hypothetical protein